jgi:hypothetical protein
MRPSSGVLLSALVGTGLLLVAACSAPTQAAREARASPAARPPAASPTLASAPASPVPPAPSPPPVRRVFVADTDGEGAFVRWTPSRDDRVKAYPEGTELEVVGPEVETEGITWRRVRAPDGLVGWIPKQYTAVDAPAPPSQ